MKPLLNLDEPVQRRSGEPAEIIKRNALGDYPVIALITTEQGKAQQPGSFTLRGSFASDDDYRDGDLINVPKRVQTGTINLRCYLMNNGEVEVRRTSNDDLQGHSDVIGSAPIRFTVRRGEWL